jgi:hypothetical protein
VPSHEKGKGSVGTSMLATRAQSLQVESIALYNFLMEHDLFGKPVSTFPDHALDKFPASM